MKKFVSLALIASTLLWGCTKVETIETAKPVGNLDLKTLDDYRPSDQNISDVYLSFKEELKLVKNESALKDGFEAVDRPVDEAVWLIETATNTEFAFMTDSIENIGENTTYIVLNNKSFTPEGVPIIDGNELLGEYTNIESTIEQRAQNDLLFWIMKMEITEVTNETTTVKMTSVEGEKSSTAWMAIPKSQTTGIEPFPDGTTNWAGDCNDEMVYAELAYFNKIKSNMVPSLRLGYIFEFVTVPPIPSPLQGETRLLWAYGSGPEWYPLNTEQLNYYLFGMKEIIDELQPTTPGHFIAYFHVYTWCIAPPSYTPAGNYTYQWWFEQVVTPWIYKQTYVGGGQD